MVCAYIYRYAYIIRTIELFARSVFLESVMFCHASASKRMLRVDKSLSGPGDTLRYSIVRRHLMLRCHLRVARCSELNYVLINLTMYLPNDLAIYRPDCFSLAVRSGDMSTPDSVSM